VSDHQGARMDRELRTWNPRLSSADAALLPDYRRLVARAQDVARNHGMMSGGIRIHLDNIIGAGLRLSAKPDYRALGQSAEWATEWSRNVEAQWRLWADDIDRYCDAGRRLSFAGMLGQAYRSYLTVGDITASAEWLPDRGGKYATAIQMIASPRLSNPNSRMDTDTLRGGIELDQMGGATAYYIRTALQSDSRFGSNTQKWRRVARETSWGRTQFIHIFDQEEPGQTRGKSGFAAILARSKMLDRFQSTSLETAIVNAMYAAVIESDFDPQSVAQAMGQEPVTDYLKNVADFHESQPVTLDGVKIPHLFPGENLRFTAASHPSPSFAEFERAMLRHLSSGLNISYEELARDYSQTNYSGARAALEQSWKFFYGRRQLIGGAFANQVYALWLEEAMDNGDVDRPSGTPDFYDAKTAWVRCRWIGPRKGHIDPLKESKADALEMDRGLLTLEDACAARGLDWEDNLEQIAREMVRKRELEEQYGVTFASTDIGAIVGDKESQEESA